jgi:hypothetical protein
MICPLSKPFDESLQPGHALGLQCVADPRSIDLTLDQPGLFEDAKVLRDGGLRQGQLIDYLSADAGALTGQQVHYLQPNWVCYRFGDRHKFLVTSVRWQAAKIQPPTWPCESVR